MLVFGPNGACKSTLRKSVFGLLGVHRGTITLGGQSIGGLAPHEIKRLGVSYVPQELNTFPHLTIEENLNVGGWTIRHDKARLKDRVARIYDIFPALAGKRRDKAGSLSGGQGRELSVARAVRTGRICPSSTNGLSPTKEEDTPVGHRHMAADAFNRTCRRAIDLVVAGQL